ncbi:MAG: DNA-3-methyladenine glycosylase family protein [Candidatus Hermodarchaeota archaeon]
MPNIFTKRVLARFTRQVPELEEIMSSKRLELDPSNESPFDMLVRSIVYQQLSGKAARTILDRLIVLVGEITPDAILSKTEDELRSVGLSRQKASYVQNVARAFGKGGSLEEYNATEALKGLSTEQMIQLFTEIKGVGEWTVQMYLIFGLGRLDVLSPGDLGVRKGVMKLYGLDELPTPGEVKKIAEKWHPLETVGTCLAWSVLRED